MRLELDSGGRHFLEISSGEVRLTHEAWSCTTLLALIADEPTASQPIAGGDDACDARWFSREQLPPRLAFDHERLLWLAVDRLYRR